MGNRYASHSVVESKDNKDLIKKQIEGLSDYEILNLGQRYVTAGNVALGLLCFELCKTKFKFYEIGNCYLKLGNDKLALTNLLEFDKIDKYENQDAISNQIYGNCVRSVKLTNARLSIAQCYYRAGDFNKAIVWYNKALMKFCHKYKNGSNLQRLCRGCTGTDPDNIRYDYYIHYGLGKAHASSGNIGFALLNYILAYSKVKSVHNHIESGEYTECFRCICGFINAHKIDENLLMSYIDKVYFNGNHYNNKSICNIFINTASNNLSITDQKVNHESKSKS